MLQEKLGDALKGAAVDQGLGGATPGSPATYVAMGPSIIRFNGGVSELFRASCGSDYGRYPKLHRHPAHDTNQ
jgi:hypothetical protein